MTRSRWKQTLQFLAILFAILPFLFAFIGDAGRHHDLRMFWMACAALIGAAAVVIVGRRGSRSILAVAGRSAAALIVAIVLAAMTGFSLGAAAPAGVWAVAFVLAFCWSIAYAFGALSKRFTAARDASTAEDVA